LQNLLSIEISGIKLSNPFIPASGCFGYGQEMEEFFSLDEWGALLTKTITANFKKGNSPPRLLETPSGLLNSIGLANPGIKKFISDIYPLYKEIQSPLIISIAGNTIEEFLLLVNKLNPLNKISALELNISCPNVKRGGIAFGVDPEQIIKLVSLIKRETDFKLITKLTPNITDIRVAAQAAQEGGSDMLTVANTYLGMAIDKFRKQPYFKNIQAGLSGPAIKPMALLRVYQVYQVVEIPIIGVGGISDVDDVIEFLLAGAAAVQIGTLIFRQPEIIADLKKELMQYMLESKIDSIEKMVGLANKKNN